MDVDKFIEDLGGIRPGARVLDLPVTTVYGWKKMGNIPYPRRIELYDDLSEKGLDVFERLFPELAIRDIGPKE